MKKFGNFGRHFPRATSAKNPRSMYGRVPQAMAQFVLKIELLSHIMGTTPILEMARAYGLRPRLWLLALSNNPGFNSKWDHVFESCRQFRCFLCPPFRHYEHYFFLEKHVCDCSVRNDLQLSYLSELNCLPQFVPFCHCENVTLKGIKLLMNEFYYFSSMKNTHKFLNIILNSKCIFNNWWN